MRRPGACRVRGARDDGPRDRPQPLGGHPAAGLGAAERRATLAPGPPRHHTRQAPATEPGAPARKPRGGGKAFERGIAALTQYTAREGTTAVPRGWIEQTPDGPHKLGVRVSNTRTRRASLGEDQRERAGRRLGLTRNQPRTGQGGRAREVDQGRAQALRRPAAASPTPLKDHGVRVPCVTTLRPSP
ncbi:Helicase associated domain protein [Streptomyces sanyensis]|uniref:Helicase associated domain protein n=1 Tax=Streptomyces sanyensis TaxID=568869 RepID=UPI003D789DCC